MWKNDLWWGYFGCQPFHSGSLRTPGKISSLKEDKQKVTWYLYVNYDEKLAYIRINEVQLGKLMWCNWWNGMITLQ